MEDDDFTKFAISRKKQQSPPKDGDDTVARVLDDEFGKLGYSPTARLSILGDVGRENSWNRHTIFGGHQDPKNQAFNRGIISWQGDRRKKLDSYLQKEGVYGKQNDDELRAMARFMNNELQNDYPDAYSALQGAKTTAEASKALQKYIKYVPTAPYNTPDADFLTQNNRKYAERAKNLGLARDFNSESFSGFVNSGGISTTASGEFTDFMSKGGPSADTEPPTPNGVPLSIPRVGQQAPPMPDDLLPQESVADAALRKIQPLATVPNNANVSGSVAPPVPVNDPAADMLRQKQIELLGHPIETLGGLTSEPVASVSDIEIPTANEPPNEAKYQEWAKVTNNPDTPENRDYYAKEVAPLIAQQDREAQQVNAKQVQGIERPSNKRTVQGAIQETDQDASQPKAETESIYVPVQWNKSTTGAAKTQAMDDAAASLASRVGVDYDVMRRYLDEGGQGWDEPFSVESAERRKQKGEAFQIGLDANAVREVKALQATTIENKRAKAKRFDDELLNSANQDSNPKITQLNALRASGQIDPEAAQKLIDEEREAMAEELGSSNGVVSQQRRIIDAAFKTQGYKDIPAYSTEEISAITKKYGGFAEKRRYENELEEKYKYRPMARPTEAALNFFRYFAKIPATAVKVAGVATDAMSPFGIPPKDNPFLQFGKAWEERVDAAENKDFKGELVVDHLSKGAGQLVAQALLTLGTGGSAGLLLPVAEAATAQYDEAANAGASRNQRMVTLGIASLAAVPDVILKAKYLRFLTPAQKTGFLTNFANSVFNGLAKETGEVAARKTTAEIVRGIISKPVFGFVAEKYQERSEDIVNDVVKKLTYQPNLTWAEIFKTTAEQEKGYLAAGLLGAIGGSFEAVTERMSDIELERYDDVVSKALADRTITSDDALQIEKAVTNELKKRGQRISKNTIKPVTVSLDENAKTNDIKTSTEVSPQPAPLDAEPLVSDQPVQGTAEVPEVTAEAIPELDALTDTAQENAPVKDVLDETPVKPANTDAEALTKPKRRGFKFDTSPKVNQGSGKVTLTPESKPTDTKEAELVSIGEAKPTTVEGKLVEQRNVALRKADTDDLTGLANPAALNKALPKAEADANTSIVKFDANNFGQVNKIAGEPEGDKAIVDVANAIKQAADEFGVSRVFRRGGDEFTVLAPNNVAESIKIRAEEIYGDKKYGGVTVSLSGTVGATDAEAGKMLQAAKKERKAAQSQQKPAFVRPKVESDGHSVEVKKLPKAAIGDKSYKTQNATIKRVQESPGKFINAYVKRHGDKILDPDKARELFREYASDPVENTNAVHAASSAVVRLLLKKRLEELPKGSKIQLTAGGPGSGKSRTTKGLDFDLTYDSLMSNKDANRENIDQIVAAGHKPIITYVHRPVKEAVASMMQRMDSATKAEDRRPVTIEGMSFGHFQSQKAILEDTAPYLLEKGGELNILENRTGKDPRRISLDELRNLAYNDIEDVRNEVRQSIKEELADGRYSRSTRNYFTRELEGVRGSSVLENDREPERSSSRSKRDPAEKTGTSQHTSAETVRKPITLIKNDLEAKLLERYKAGEKLPAGVSGKTEKQTTNNIGRYLDKMPEGHLRDWHSTIFDESGERLSPKTVKQPSELETALFGDAESIDVPTSDKTKSRTLSKIPGTDEEITHRQLELKRAVKSELYDRVSSIIYDDELRVSLEAAEILRVASAGIDGMAISDAPLIEGLFLDEETAPAFIKALNKFADMSEARGLDGGNLRRLSDSINIATERNGTAIISIDPSVAPHERVHQYSHIHADSKDFEERHGLFKEITELKTDDGESTLFDKAFDHFFAQHGYDRTDKGLLVEEMAAYSATGDYDTIGLTKSEAARFTRLWLDSYVRKNGIEILDDLEKYLDESLETAETIARLREEGNVGADSGLQSGEVRGRPASDRELPRSSESKTAGGTRSREQTSDTEGIKARRFQQTLENTARGTFKPSKYFPETMAGWKGEAESILAENSLQEAEILFHKPDELKPAVKNALGLALIDLYGQTGNVDKVNEIAGDMITSATDLGRAIKALDLANRYDPASWSFAAEKLKAKSKSGPLTTEEFADGKQKVERYQSNADDYELAESLIAKADDTRSRMDAAEAKIDKMVDLPETPSRRVDAELAELKKDVDRLTKELEKLKAGKAKPVKRVADLAEALKRREKENLSILAAFARTVTGSTTVLRAVPKYRIENDDVGLSEEVFNAIRDVATQELLRILPEGKVGYSTFTKTLEKATGGKLSPKQIDQITAAAITEIRQTREHTFPPEQLAKQENRRLFYQKAQQVLSAQHKQYVEDVRSAIERADASPRDAFSKQMVLTAAGMGVSGKELIGANLLKITHDLGRWRRMFNDIYPGISKSEADAAYKVAYDLKRATTADLKRLRADIKANRQLTDDEYKELEREKRRAISRMMRSRADLEAYYKSLTQTKFQKGVQAARQITNIGRTIQASFDVSFAGRQGMALNALETRSSMVGLLEGIRHSLTQEEMDNFVFEMENDPIANEMKELGWSSRALMKDVGEYEEFYLSQLPMKLAEFEASTLPGKIAAAVPKVVGKGFQISERAFELQGDMQGYRVYEKWKTLIDEMAADHSNIDADRAKKYLIRVINAGTGRGNLTAILGKDGGFQKVLSEVLYSPRFWLSKPEFIFYTSPLGIVFAPKGARKILAKKSMGMYGKTVAIFLSIAALGLTSLDPEDDEFMQIRYGNRKVDITGGRSGELKTVFMMAKGAYYYGMTQIGDQEQARYGAAGMRRIASYYSDANEWVRTFRGKSSPQASLIYDAIDGKDYLGRPFTWSNGLATRLIPLTFQNAWNALTYDEKESVLMRPAGWDSFTKNVGKLMSGELNKNLGKVALSLPLEAIGIGGGIYDREADTTARAEATRLMKYNQPAKTEEDIEKENAELIDGSPKWRVVSSLIRLKRFGYDITPELEEYKAKGLSDEDVQKINDRGSISWMEDKLAKASLPELQQVLKFTTPYEWFIRPFAVKSDPNRAMERERIEGMIALKREDSRDEEELKEFEQMKADVRSGKKPKADTIKDLRRKAAIGEISYETMDARIGSLDVSQIQEKAQNFDASTGADFRQIERFLSGLNTDEKRSVYQILKAKADDKSEQVDPKFVREGRQLNEIIRKYYQNIK